ncbi:KTSC domain-containing protein [Acinetobacter sp. RF15A]|uniref:KTSC domain-containing protein n=1 Tax=unclassified Acinetobacter TaxID=196816 RepID=UPI001194E531|nr:MULTISPECIES: KTSC domain-containing protein [unclassified Acinetobacter]TSH74917.1 KTSC domain-containing protein [Acinetobacter sp. RF15A]TSI20386.1 KTSC domain-containing protein [Acinetobacter sp. RF15B]
MQTIEINSHKISRVSYQWHLLTVEMKTGERFIYRLLDASTFKEFIDAADKDRFYRGHIEANKKFKRVQLFG